MGSLSCFSLVSCVMLLFVEGTVNSTTTNTTAREDTIAESDLSDAVSAEGKKFHLKVTASPVGKTQAIVNICVGFTGVGDEKPGITILEVDSLTGYQFDEDLVVELNSTKSGFENVECMDHWSHSIFPFENGPTEQEQCYNITQIKVFKVTQMQDRQAKIYEYYYPEMQKTVLYNMKE